MITQLCNDFLPWEDRPKVHINDLQEIIFFEGQDKIETIDSIVRICRLDRNNRRLPLSIKGKYKISHEISLAFDYYNLEVVTNKKNFSYSLNDPILIVSLGVDYYDEIPISGILEPYDPELVEFLYSSQIVAQWEILNKLTKIKPRVFVTRENLLQNTFELKLDSLTPIIKQKEKDIGYEEANPHVTKYAFPGSRLDSYSPYTGFSEYKNPSFENIIKAIMGSR